MKNLLIAGLVALNITAPTTVTKEIKEIKTPTVTINKEESLQENIKRNLADQNIAVKSITVNSRATEYDIEKYPDKTLDTVEITYYGQFLPEEYLYKLVNTALRTANNIDNSIDSVWLNGYALYGDGYYYINDFLNSSASYNAYKFN